jgi:hypothetical protein
MRYVFVIILIVCLSVSVIAYFNPPNILNNCKEFHGENKEYVLLWGGGDPNLVRLDDKCNGTQLIDNYCKYGKHESVVNDCPNGCANGACLICTDSDDGRDYYTKGQAMDAKNSVYEDFCADATQVNEYFCNYTKVETRLFTCPHGCKDGACISLCSDSDGGINPYVKGICKDSRGSFSDDCVIYNGSSSIPRGSYVDESFCLTWSMIRYCTKSNTEEYCETLPRDCYGGPLMPYPDNNYYNYYPKNDSYICKNGCYDGACLD